MSYRKAILCIALMLLVSFAVTASGEREERRMPISDEDYDYETLVRLAEEEGELTVTDTSSRIEPVIEAFMERYDIVATGTKMGNPEQIERVRREVDAGAVQTDVIGISDAPTLVNDLIPNGYVESWVPPDMRDLIPEQYQNPLTYRMGIRMFGYNSEVYDESPVTNMWELTEPRWKGKVMLRDPAQTPDNIGFFATLTRDDHAQALAEAYERHYGEELVTDEPNAGWEWIKRFFRNDPVTFASDSDVGDAVGAPGQTDPPFGFYVYTKQRDAIDGDLRLSVAFEVEPFIGYPEETKVAIVNGTSHPNAARLFVRFLLTEEGVGRWTLEDLGGYSPNPEIGTHPDDVLGSFEAWQDYIIPLDRKLTWELQQEIVDLWLVETAR